MRIVSLADARMDLVTLLDRMDQDGEPLLIERTTGASVVMVPERDWAALNETLHQFSPAANADRLRKSIAQLDAGQTVEYDRQA